MDLKKIASILLETSLAITGFGTETKSFSTGIQTKLFICKIVL